MLHKIGRCVEYGDNLHVLYEKNRKKYFRICLLLLVLAFEPVFH